MRNYAFMVFLLLLALLVCVLIFPGCGAGKMVLDRSEDVIKLAQQLHCEGEVDGYITPNGSVNFGPGASYTNGSYLHFRLSAKGEE